MKFRPLEPEDIPQLFEIWKQQCADIGESFAFPNFVDQKYYRSYVAVRDGCVVGAIVAHATTEIMFLGDSPKVVRAAIQNREALEECFRRAGADELHAFVPRSRERGMRGLLRRLGFRRSNRRYVPWFREL